MKKLMIIVFFWTLSMANAFSEPAVFKSNESQTGVIELYTSEGCSSCPPADRYLTKLKQEEGVWSHFIPMAFHVDYWDYIGWKDRFASPDYSNRQRIYALQQSSSTIYTPGFLFNGEEWRGWRFSNLVGFPDTENAPGVLEISVDDNVVAYKFSPKGAIKSDLLFNIALLGFDLKTEVSRGENAGRELAHDFVVLDINKSPVSYEDGSYKGTIKLPKTDINVPKYGVAAWVHTGDNLTPIQAVGGYLN